jgi:PadR family transcriptional regulator PadR
MVSKALVAAATTPLVLTILRRGENCGSQIIQSVRKLSDGKLEWSEPVPYPLLKRMEREGLIRSEQKLTANRRFRLYFRLTEKGRGEQDRAEWFLINDLFGILLELEPVLEN